jgi:hypothetical protein
MACRHLEVQASFNPAGYLTKVPQDQQKAGQKAGSAKIRSDEELSRSVREWIHKKFDHPKKSRTKETAI